MRGVLKRRFVWADHSDMGDGFCPQWMGKACDPVEGFGAAHDSLEHFPKCIGGMEGEMMAFGAMHYVRRDTPFNRATIYEAQHSDIGMFLRDHVIYGDQRVKDPGRVHLRNLEWLDLEELRHWVRKGVHLALREVTHGERENLAHFRRMLPANIDERLVGWIVKGFHKARGRFERLGLDNWDCHELFQRVQEGFDKVVTHGSGEPGEVVDVYVHWQDRRVNVVRDYDYAAG